MRHSRNADEMNFWAGYADCMLALFMIALLLWIVSSGITEFRNSSTGAEITNLRDAISKLEKEKFQLQKDLRGRDEEIKILKQKLKDFSDWESRLAELERLRSENSELNTQLTQLKKQNVDLKNENTQLKENLRKLAINIEVMSDKIDAVTKALNGQTIDEFIDSMKTLQKELNDKPPIINLTGGAAREFLFPSGKADLPPAFKKRLRKETFPELQNILISYNKIDTLEIVGHTDGIPIERQGNLDIQIPKLLDGTAREGTLVPGSNTDLGLMRALAIRNEWNEWVLLKTDEEKIRLKQISVRCYSAAQTVPVVEASSNFDWLKEDESARRIEIRFLQLGDIVDQTKKNKNSHRK